MDSVCSLEIGLLSYGTTRSRIQQTWRGKKKDYSRLVHDAVLVGTTRQTTRCHAAPLRTHPISHVETIFFWRGAGPKPLKWK